MFNAKYFKAKLMDGRQTPVMLSLILGDGVTNGTERFINRQVRQKEPG